MRASKATPGTTNPIIANDSIKAARKIEYTTHSWLFCNQSNTIAGSIIL